MAEPKKPQDRQAPKATKTQTAKQKEALAKLMETGLNFEPFTVDAGDGVVWEFTPDPMPAQTEALISAFRKAEKAASDLSGMDEAFAELFDVIRSRLIHKKQQEEFPRPLYGQNAAMFFAMHLATGRDGFPTE